MSASGLVPPALLRYASAAERAREPIRRFLARHAHAGDRAMFHDLAVRLRERHAEPDSAAAGGPDPAGAGGGPDPAGAGGPDSAASADPAQAGRPDPAVADTDLAVLAPAFVTSELTEAFAIGFLLFLPFLIIDLVVASALQSLGMHMLSPTTVSLPFKLLLFVIVDGWALVAEGLILGYA